jgi:hypothetical protein
MKLAGVWETADYFSKTASEINRTLAISAIAVIWVFKSDSPQGPHVAHEFLWPGICALISLTLDLAQYVWGEAVWRRFGLRIEKRKQQLGSAFVDDFLAPSWMNYPTTAFFWAKILFVALSYCLLLRVLISRVLE